MNLNFRTYTESDIDKLVEFWCENSGWDIIDRKEWERRFYHLPWGHAEIVIAEKKDDRSILAQFVFIPSEISISGHTYKAYRPFAPIIHKNHRIGLNFLSLSKYIIGMYNFAINTFSKRGIGLVHMMPDPRWVRLLHFMKGVIISSFQLQSLYLNTSIPITLKKQFTFEEINPGDERIDSLWQKFSKIQTCSIVRNSNTLPWKLSHGDYKMIGIFKDSQLTGFSASRFKSNDKQWLICDLLFDNTGESLMATLQSTCLYALAFKAGLQEEDQVNFTKISILATKSLDNTLSQLGFEDDKYKFPFVVHLLAKDIPKSSIKADNWYLSAND